MGMERFTAVRAVRTWAGMSFGSLGDVAKERITIRYQAREEAFEIVADGRVRVFLDEKRSGRVGEMNGEQALAEAGPTNGLLDLLRDLDQAPSVRGNVQYPRELAQHESLIAAGSA